MTLTLEIPDDLAKQLSTLSEPERTQITLFGLREIPR
jgi:hypothetical protein